MKKLLLSAMLAAACMSDVNASAFQTKASKNSVDTILKEDMGNYYKGMVNLVNALLVGWADSLSYATKDPDFKSEKTQLSNAGKKLKIIAKFTESMLNRDREKGITSNQSKAVAAAQAFRTVVSQLKSTEYWKHCGAQLRFSIVIITNALQSLAQKEIQFNVAGTRVSSFEGLIDGNGYSVNYDLADDNVLIRDDSSNGKSKVSSILTVFKNISRDLTVTSVNTNVQTTSVSSLDTFGSTATLNNGTSVETISQPQVQNSVTQAQTVSQPQVQNSVTQAQTVSQPQVQKSNVTPAQTVPQSRVSVLRGRR